VAISFPGGTLGKTVTNGDGRMKQERRGEGRRGKEEKEVADGWSIGEESTL